MADTPKDMPSRDTTAKAAGAKTTGEDIQAELQVLREDIAKLSRQMADVVGGAGGDAMRQVRAGVRRARESVDGVISDAEMRGREAADAVRDVTDTFAEAIEESVQKRPFTTLAMAIGVGFLFGAAWRR
jgi:ElaB/YqjD/DUF883 family membrane-anchored ribosome-binding protein